MSNETTAPSKADIKRFLECFRRLDGFESSQRAIRGYGAFDPVIDQSPDPSVTRVMEWLEGQAQ